MDETLKALIGQVDDDYLTGLSNKGTVKRAYKDLVQETPAVSWTEGTARVKLKEETCVIREPLGESSCSCPSRSVCRHVVTAILWLKQELLQDGPEDGRPENGGVPPQKSEDKEELHTADENHTEKEPKLLEEILRIPAERLKRACRGKRYQQFLERLRAGEGPVIEESSIVTVMIPWDQAVVKLLEPFDYSTCTCHSRELCAHKAQAVLAYQMEKGRITWKDLEVLKEAEQAWDVEQVHSTCGSVCRAVGHQICTGLSRQSPEVSESLERLAVISHRAGLASLETRLREASSEYQQYFQRSAAFRSGELLRRLLMIHGLAERLQKASGQEEIRSLAGSFRDTYEPAGQLHLIGMGGRTFSSRTGYEGEIYYFLEPEQKRWYTWTDARPVFYEGVRRRPPAAAGNAMAPWGLNCSREQLQSLEFDLLHAKTASGGRLSVSKDSKGEALGERSLCQEGVKELVFWDYEALLLEHFGISEEGSEIQNRASGRREKLALAGAVRWGETVFDTVEQRFSWSLYDRNGRSLYISLKYTKEENMTIRLLERLQKRLQKRSGRAIVFFGSVYLDENGRLCLYPIEFFIKEAEELAEQEGLPGVREEMDAPESAGGRQDAAAQDRKASDVPPKEILRSMEQYRREAAGQLSDLFVSGLYSIQDNVIGRLSELSSEGERMGLHYAGAAFGRIGRGLEERRHQMEYSPEPVLREMGALERYLQACGKKLSCDMALLTMREKQ